MNKYFKGLLIAACATITAPIWAKASLVAVLDMQKVVAENPEYNKLRAEIEKEFTPKQEKISADAKNLEKALKDFSKNKPTMSKAAAKKEEERLKTMRQKLETDSQALQRGVFKKQSDGNNRIIASIKTAAKTIAKKEGFDVVMAAESTLYSQNDITTKVIDMLK